MIKDYMQFHNDWDESVQLDQPESMIEAMRESIDSDVYMYTQHEVFLEENLLKQTRSSPNYEGKFATFATCKHRMRTGKRNTWEGVWLISVAPKKCANNTILFAGRIGKSFASNYEMGEYIFEKDESTYEAKSGENCPRGDIIPTSMFLAGEDRFDHNNFDAPRDNHTRVLDLYKKSPGSVSKREDGLIPKWWRDVEYKTNNGSRPPCFIFDKFFLFSKPTLWSGLKPLRATIRPNMETVINSLRGEINGSTIHNP